MNGTVLALHGLRVLDDRGDPLVHGLDLELRGGEKLGFVGESGSGKSLTLRAILDILPEGLTREGAVERTPRAAMIFQEPSIALNPTMRVGRFVARAWQVHHPGDSAQQCRAGARSLLEQVGISRAAERMSAWPHELSGGMRQRVMIAAALATEPELLLCDEPTTALDVLVQSQILELLRKLVAEKDMALVFVSHDLAVVSELCDRILVLRGGAEVERGSLAEVLAAPRQDYTRELLAANLARRITAGAGAGTGARG